MIKLKNILVIALLMTSMTLAARDNNSDNDRQNKWMNEYREFKQEFLSKEVDLTPSQKSEFFPLYNEMEQEIYNVNLEARKAEQTISQKDDASNNDYLEAAKLMVDVKTKEARIETEYFEKFAKILDSRQLFLLKRAETRFSRNMLQHHKEASRRTR